MSSFEASGAALLARRRGSCDFVPADPWAFSDYIGLAGGCDAIKAINCDATNGLAVAHYEAKGSEYADALACLEKRCGLDAKTTDEAYKEFDNKEPWDEVLS